MSSSRQKARQPQPVTSGAKVKIDQEEYLWDGDSSSRTGHNSLTPTRGDGFRSERTVSSIPESRGYPASDMTSPCPSAMSSVVSVDAISIGSSQDEDDSYVAGVESAPPARQYVKSQTHSSVPSIVSTNAPAADARSQPSIHGLVVSPTDGMLSPPLHGTLTRHSTSSSGTKIDSSDTHNQWSRPTPTSEFTIPHLPPPSPCQRLTSLPIWLVQRDLEFAAMKLMSPEVYRDFITNSSSRRKFRDYLIKEGTVGALDCEWDGKVVEELAGQIRSASQNLYDAYIDRRSATVINLPDGIRQQLLEKLKQLAVVDAGLSSVQKHITDQLYTGAFQRYCKFRLIEASHVKLGNSHVSNGMTTDGLGDCFCITNPRLHDHPIVLCSDGFVAVTGYPREAILGRNCRFLQGPGTSPDAVRRIREGISSGDGCTELLLNYRLTGEPFWCLICIIPLRDAASNITYFIGGQVNVTSALASGSKLDFLIPGTAPESSAPEPAPLPEILPSGSQIIYSPTLQADNAARRTQGNGLMMSQFMSNDAPNSTSLAGSILTVPSDGNKSSDVLGVSPNKRKSSRFGWKAKEKRLVGEQLLPGAEDVLGDSGFLPLQDQFGIAEATYSRVLVLNVSKREIIFITPQLLAFLGLPFAAVEDKFNSRLLHTDLLDVITGDDKAHQKALRQNVKDIVKSGKPGSIAMAFKVFNKQNLTFSMKSAKLSRAGILHLTPLKERGNKVVAYVALFGESRLQSVVSSQTFNV